MKTLIGFMALFLSSYTLAAAVDCRSAVQAKNNPFLQNFDQLAASENAEGFFRAYDKRALEVAQQLALKKGNLATEVQTWFNAIKADNLSVVEFTTLQLILKAEYMKESIPAETRAEILSHLQKNWLKFTGQSLSKEKALTAQFPAQVLKTQDVRVQRFHALTSKINGQTLEIEPGKMGKIINKLAPLALLTMGLTATGGDAIAGALIGYSVSLAAEYWIHRFVMHSGKSVDKLPWYLKMTKSTSKEMLELAQLHFSHHQELPASNYSKKEGSDRMDSEYVKNTLTPKLVDNGLTPERIEVYVVETKHATVMEKRGWKSAHTTIVPASIAAAALVAGDPIVASMTAALMAYSFIVHVNYVHPMMHLKRTEINATRNSFDRWFSETDYFRYIARFHYMHHAKPNTNLSVLPLGYDSLVGTESYLPLHRLLKMMEEDWVY